MNGPLEIEVRAGISCILKAVGAGSTSQAVPRQPGRSPSRRNRPRSASDAGRYTLPPFQTETSLACGWMPLHGWPLYPCPLRANEEISPDRRITRLTGQRGSSVEIVSCREWDSYAISYLCWFYRLECSERRWQYNGDRFTRMPGWLYLQNQAPPGRLG